MAAGSPDAVILAHFNPRLPRTAGPWIHVGRIHAAIEEDVAPLTVDERTPDATSKSIARRVANEVDDGDTLQVGIGKLGSAIWSSLRDHSNLRIHTGMVSDGVLALIRSGALAPSGPTPPITTGVALGSQDLYEALAEPTLCRFAGTDTTHDFAVISSQRSMVAINSALEVDLLGQVNAESLDGKLVSGIGGLADFARAAQAGEGGRSIIALPSTTSKGVSRIVARLGTGAVPISRTDTDLVCTEHGAARVRHLGMNARALALISIAHPNHQEQLTREWRVLREQL